MQVELALPGLIHYVVLPQERAEELGLTAPGATAVTVAASGHETGPFTDVR
jgi:hypothetical protein